MTVQEAKKHLENMFPKNQDKRRFIEECIDMAIESMEELEQYRALGTVEELKEAREKQVAKKVVYEQLPHGSAYHCLVCGAEQIKVEFLSDKNPMPKEMHSWCWHCGQKIDWKEGAENGKI